jgi:hypothetical protein
MQEDALDSLHALGERRLLGKRTLNEGLQEAQVGISHLSPCNILESDRAQTLHPFERGQARLLTHVRPRFVLIWAGQLVIHEIEAR